MSTAKLATKKPGQEKQVSFNVQGVQMERRKRHDVKTGTSQTYPAGESSELREQYLSQQVGGDPSNHSEFKEDNTIQHHHDIEANSSHHNHTHDHEVSVISLHNEEQRLAQQLAGSNPVAPKNFEIPLPHKEDPVVNKVNSFIIESNINVIKAVPKNLPKIAQVRGPTELRQESSNESKVDNPFSHSGRWKASGDAVRNYQIRKSNNESQDKVSSLTRRDELPVFQPIRNQNFNYFDDLDSSSQLKQSSIDKMRSTGRKGSKKSKPIMAATQTFQQKHLTKKLNISAWNIDTPVVIKNEIVEIVAHHPTGEEERSAFLSKNEELKNKLKQPDLNSELKFKYRLDTTSQPAKPKARASIKKKSTRPQLSGFDASFDKRTDNKNQIKGSSNDGSPLPSLPTQRLVMQPMSEVEGTHLIDQAINDKNKFVQRSNRYGFGREGTLMQTQQAPPKKSNHLTPMDSKPTLNGNPSQRQMNMTLLPKSNSPLRTQDNKKKQLYFTKQRLTLQPSNQTSLERSQMGYSDYADEALIQAHQRQEQISHMLIKERISPLHVQKLQANIIKHKSYYRPSKKSNFLSIKEEINQQQQKHPSPKQSSKGALLDHPRGSPGSPTQQTQIPLNSKPAYSPISTKYGEFKQKNKLSKNVSPNQNNNFSRLNSQFPSRNPSVSPGGRTIPQDPEPTFKNQVKGMKKESGSSNVDPNQAQKGSKSNQFTHSHYFISRFRGSLDQWTKPLGVVEPSTIGAEQVPVNSLAGPGSSPYNQVFLNSFYSSKTMKRPSRNDTSPKEKAKQQYNKDIERQFSRSTFEKQLEKQDLRPEPLRQQEQKQITNPDQPLANSILSKISQMSEVKNPPPPEGARSKGFSMQRDGGGTTPNSRTTSQNLQFLEDFEHERKHKPRLSQGFKFQSVHSSIESQKRLTNQFPKKKANKEGGSRRTSVQSSQDRFNFQEKLSKKVMPKKQAKQEKGKLVKKAKVQTKSNTSQKRASPKFNQDLLPSTFDLIDQKNGDVHLYKNIKPIINQDSVRSSLRDSQNKENLRDYEQALLDGQQSSLRNDVTPTRPHQQVIHPLGMDNSPSTEAFPGGLPEDNQNSYGQTNDNRISNKGETTLNQPEINTEHDISDHDTTPGLSILRNQRLERRPISGADGDTTMNFDKSSIEDGFRHKYADHDSPPLQEGEFIEQKMSTNAAHFPEINQRRFKKINLKQIQEAQAMSKISAQVHHSKSKIGPNENGEESPDKTSNQRQVLADILQRDSHEQTEWTYPFKREADSPPKEKRDSITDFQVQGKRLSIYGQSSTKKLPKGSPRAEQQLQIQEGGAIQIRSTSPAKKQTPESPEPVPVPYPAMSRILANQQLVDYKSIATTANRGKEVGSGDGQIKFNDHLNTTQLAVGMSTIGNSTAQVFKIDHFGNDNVTELAHQYNKVQQVKILKNLRQTQGNFQAEAKRIDSRTERMANSSHLSKDANNQSQIDDKRGGETSSNTGHLQEDSLDAVIRESSKPRYLRKMAEKRHSDFIKSPKNHPPAVTAKALLFINNIDLTQLNSTMSHRKLLRYKAKDGAEAGVPPEKKYSKTGRVSQIEAGGELLMEKPIAVDKGQNFNMMFSQQSFQQFPEYFQSQTGLLPQNKMSNQSSHAKLASNAQLSNSSLPREVSQHLRRQNISLSGTKQMESTSGIPFVNFGLLNNVAETKYPSQYNQKAMDSRNASMLFQDQVGSQLEFQTLPNFSQKHITGLGNVTLKVKSKASPSPPENDTNFTHSRYYFSTLKQSGVDTQQQSKHLSLRFESPKGNSFFRQFHAGYFKRHHGNLELFKNQNVNDLIKADYGDQYKIYQSNQHLVNSKTFGTKHRSVSGAPRPNPLSPKVQQLPSPVHLLQNLTYLNTLNNDRNSPQTQMQSAGDDRELLRSKLVAQLSESNQGNRNLSELKTLTRQMLLSSLRQEKQNARQLPAVQKKTEAVSPRLLAEPSIKGFTQQSDLDLISPKLNAPMLPSLLHQ